MFKLDLSDYYEYPVSFSLMSKSGKLMPQGFTAHFRRMSKSEITELQQSAMDGAISDEDYIARILIGWDGIKNDDGSDLPFTESARRAVCDVHPVGGAVIKAFGESLRVVMEKN